MSSPIRKLIEAKESNRVFALRIISAVLGVGVAVCAKMDVIAMIGGTSGGAAAYLGYVIAGLAAAGGSSFWHDQLDRVRALKQAGESVASLTATVRKS